ncbi:hypothetical protein [Streptomyces prasinosporus]|uniref:hypothetical protein n=1 Tax=Streptomyces prasinosporus TaxID=68256 RepID=UPI0031F0FE37
MLALPHTSPVHVPVFDALRDEDLPGLQRRHLVAEDLLRRARLDGPAAVAEGVRAKARRAGRAVGVRAVLVEGARARFEAGDPEGYVRRVADAADGVTGADVIVLAQASMAPAGRLGTAGVPVLSSPRPGLAAGAAGFR